MKIAIIGGSLAGEVLAFQLGEVFEDLQIDLYDDSQGLPGASLNSTGLSSVHGVSSGVSPLGDLLLKSSQYLENWINEKGVRGFEKGDELVLIDRDQLDLKSRYNVKAQNDQSIAVGEMTLFSPPSFFTSLKERGQARVDRKNQLVTGLRETSEGVEVTSLSQKKTLRSRVSYQWSLHSL